MTFCNKNHKSCEKKLLNVSCHLGCHCPCICGWTEGGCMHSCLYYSGFIYICCMESTKCEKYWDIPFIIIIIAVVVVLPLYLLKIRTFRYKEVFCDD